jgi:alkylhydroperoxidase family enzyme
MAPRIPLDTELLDEYGVGDATGLTPSYSAARDRMLAAMHGLDRVDPVTHELCRLRNAHLQQCQVCMRFRYTDTDEGLLAAAQQYESSEVLTTRQKLALSLTDIYLRAPAEPTAGLREELLREFSPEELIELILRQVRYTWNKTLVALALDGEPQLVPPAAR